MPEVYSVSDNFSNRGFAPIRVGFVSERPVDSKHLNAISRRVENTFGLECFSNPGGSDTACRHTVHPFDNWCGLRIGDKVVFIFRVF